MTPRDRFEELLELWLDDALSPTERAEWDSLLAADDSLRIEAEQEARLVALLRQAGERRAPENLLSTALAKAREPIKVTELSRAERRRGNPWAFGSVAAMLFVGLIVWALYQDGVDAPELTPTHTTGRVQTTTSDSTASDTVAPAETKQAPPESPAPVHSPGDVWRFREDTPPSAAPESRARELAEAPPVEPDTVPQDADLHVFFSTAFEETAPSPALENRAALERLVQNRRARVVVDTRWRATAEAIAQQRLALAETQQGDGLRYVVLEIPQITSDVQALALLETQTDESEDSRVVLAYRDATAQPQFLARAAKATIAIESFDDFLSHMEQQGAQFLHYTADRELALKPYWKDETTALLDARALTPTPEPTPESERPKGFEGYVVFFLEDPETAARLLMELPTLAGDGMRNLDPSLAELIAQPQGARLVIPYRIAD